MPKYRYAESTKVEVAQTIADVQSLLAKYGGDRFRHITHINQGVFTFSYAGYFISVGFDLDNNPQERRRIYRATLLYIKAQLEAVASGIVSPAQAFAVHIVDNEGNVLMDKIRLLLPKPEKKKDE